MNQTAPDQCLVCGGTASKTFELVPAEAGESFEVFVCSHCGIGETRPVPEDLSPYYQNYYGKRHGITARYRARRRLSRVSRYVKDGSLLDIGYGEGTFLDLAASKGYKCAGVERFSANTARAFETFDDVETIRHSADCSFAVVTLWHSLEHLEDPNTALDTINDILSTDGSVFIAVPNFASRQATIFGKNWLHLDVPRHLFHFTPESLEKMLSEHGFQIADIWHHESEYDIMGWSQSTLNAVFDEKSIFFNTLTGKPTSAGPFTRSLNFLAGMVFSAAALPLVLLDIATKRGGTIVVRATRK